MANFLGAIVYAAVYSGIVSLIQTWIHLEANHESWGKAGRNFWGRFLSNWVFNFAVTLIGLTVHGISTGFKASYEIGWSGVFSEAENGLGRAFSSGFFQSTNNQGVKKFWHEAGHSLNFFLTQSLSGGSNIYDDRFWQKPLSVGFSFYGLHGLGSLGGKWNIFTGISEGSADFWSPEFGFKESSHYNGPLGEWAWFTNL